MGELAAAGHPDDIVLELLRESLGHGDILPARLRRAIEMSGRLGANLHQLVDPSDYLKPHRAKGRSAQSRMAETQSSGSRAT